MFKNMLIYSVHPETAVLLNHKIEVEEVLLNCPAGDPSGGNWRVIGFAPISETHPDQLCFIGAGRASIFRAVISERNLPGAVIREHVMARARKIEEREDRKVYKKEYAQLKDEVTLELLPKAFIRRTVVPMMFIPAKKNHDEPSLLVVGTSSQKKADDVLNVLREALGSLKVMPRTYSKPFEALLNYVANDVASNFLCNGNLKVSNPHGKQITLKGVDVLSEEVVEIMQDCSIREMGLTYLSDEGVGLMEFGLTSTGIFKGVKMSGLLNEKIRENVSDDADEMALIDAGVYLWSEELKALDESIFKLLNGTIEADNGDDEL